MSHWSFVGQGRGTEAARRPLSFCVPACLLLSLPGFMRTCADSLSAQPTWTSSHQGHPSVSLLLLSVKRLRGPGAEAQGARSGVPRTSWLSPGMHYSICGELHFDFLKSPALWLFLLSLVAFKAVAEGLPESLALSGFSILLGTFLCAFWGQRRVTR